MKNIFFSLIFLFSVFIGKAEDRSESFNSFVIKKRSIDTSLTENTSRLKITSFSAAEFLIVNYRIGLNEIELLANPDNSGFYQTNIKSGKYKLYFYAVNYDEIISDSIVINSQEVLEIDLHFTLANRMYEVLKPVIYVYPEKETAINIKLIVNGKLGFTYPLYNEGWNFTASRGGNILLDNKEYNYLFWESKMPKYSLDRKDNTGFLVSTDTLLPFLENSLSQMGFNSKESADFITFWYPRMMMNEKNFVKFLFNESCDAYAELKITPQPDHIFRVGMVWGEATTDFIPEKQVIQSLNRKGFTILEWGGMIDNTLFNPEK